MPSRRPPGWRAGLKSAHARDRLQINVAQGAGHTVTGEQIDMALDWLARWLKALRAPL